MENTAGKKSAKEKTDKLDKIRDAYITYVLEHNQEPPSVFQFMKSLRMKEETFYNYFNSFSSLEKDVWKSFFAETMERIESEPVFAEYSIREKLLAFYFTLIEVLKSRRSYVLYSIGKARFVEISRARGKGAFMGRFKNEFKDFANEILTEGRETDEIVDRPVIGNSYDEVIWQQLVFVLNFWVKDDSNRFERTDAAIEKAVNLTFDIIGRSLVDSAVDFARFLTQRR